VESAVRREAGSGQFVAEARQIRGVVSVVLRIRDDVIREQSRHVVLEVDDRVDDAVEKSGRHIEVTVIGEDSGLAEQAGTEGHAGRVELREVELDHIVLRHQFGGDPAEGWGKHALADADGNRYADDLHAIHRLLAGQGRVILRGHHCDIVPAAHKRPRQSFCIDRKPRSVRAIIGENGQDFHKRVGL
jgi:hypothetical protein